MEFKVKQMQVIPTEDVLRIIEKQLDLLLLLGKPPIQVEQDEGTQRRMGEEFIFRPEHK